MGHVHVCSFDTSLTDVGVEQARKAKGKAKGLRPTPELLVVSPLSRALHTADLAFPSSSVDCPRILHPLARERLYLSSDVGLPRSLPSACCCSALSHPLCCAAAASPSCLAPFMTMYCAHAKDACCAGQSSPKPGHTTVQSMWMRRFGGTLLTSRTPKVSHLSLKVWCSHILILLTSCTNAWAMLWSPRKPVIASSAYTHCPRLFEINKATSYVLQMCSLSA